jgi:phosphoribosylglycinamide formyltransferase-1
LKRLVIFASGGGSNARNILNYFRNNQDVQVALIVSNRSDAGVLNIAKEFGLNTKIIHRQDFTEPDTLVQELVLLQTDMIILAGFLWKIPQQLVKQFPQAIINIHPALLPKYGGKGMYGHFVHEAVHANREKESGITIHFVNEFYDEGQVIFQAKAKVEESDSPVDIERKVRALEIEHFPKVIEECLKNIKQ